MQFNIRSLWIYCAILYCGICLLHIFYFSDINCNQTVLSVTQVEFPPDLCSRVTFVNFTVTRSSLQSQCLNQVLKAERPDVDAKRSDLLKLQGASAVMNLAHWL